MDQPQRSARQVAYKVNVKDILDSRYVKEDGWLPNYIEMKGKKVSRANILGVIVSLDSPDADSSFTSYILDDGTGRIPLRFFESHQQVSVGDIVTVIGRPREFGSDRYIVPEIIKITDAAWVKLRRMELAFEKNRSAQRMPDESRSQPDVSSSEGGLDVETEEIADDVVDETSPVSRIMGCIKELDGGAGVAFEDISVKSGVDDAEQYIQRLLEQGDIFEVKPGRYKILE